MTKKSQKKIEKPLPKPEAEKIHPVKSSSGGISSKTKLFNGVKKTKIRVIGIGGGAGNIVSEIASKIKKASFVVANTDIKALKTTSRKAIRFQFGQNLTQGLGTGMNPELGEMAAQDEKERIKKILENQDLLILLACLGGGTASGATPIFAKISRNLGNLTLGIFTLPFKFEGEKKLGIALSALEKLRPRVNAFLVIPNERIFQMIDKKTPLKVALSAINKMLSESLEGLIEMIYEPGLINIDFADLRTILDGQGKLSYLNTVKVQKKEGAAQEAVEKVLNNPLYPYSIRGSKGILLNIAGERDLELSQVSQISKTISELANKEAKIIFGISQTPKYSDIIQTTLLATGCQIKILPKKPKKRLRPTRRPLTHPPAIEKEEKKIIEKTPAVKKKPKKVKIEVPKEAKEIEVKPVAAETDYNPPATRTPPQIRKNALQIKKEVEEAEQELLEKEKIWETPAFLRRQKLS
jgi:cell division protein FtsZ